MPTRCTVLLFIACCSGAGLGTDIHHTGGVVVSLCERPEAQLLETGHHTSCRQLQRRPQTELHAAGWFGAPSEPRPPFEIVSSVVTDEATGERLTPAVVVRGTTRLETIYFKAYERLEGLRRTTITLMKFGPVWKRVKTEILNWGTYVARSRPHAYVMPKAEIPTTKLACGRYRLLITYTTENHEKPVRDEVHEFAIV